MSGGVAETGRDCLCSSCQSVLVRRAPAALKVLLGGARRHLVAVGAELLGREEPEVVGGVVVAALHDGVVRERAQHRDRLPLLPRLLERLLRLLEAVALGEPLSVRQVDARGERRVLLHQLQGIVPHLSLEREREEALGVAWR